MKRPHTTFRLSWQTSLAQFGHYAAALVLLIIVRESGLTQRGNLLAYDLAVQKRSIPSGSNTPVRIIGIDEGDIKRYGPLVPDALLANAIEILDGIGVRAIGLDMFCGQGVGPGQDRLRQLAVNNPRLVSIFFQPHDKTAIPGTPPGRQANVDLYVDPADGVLRRDLLHVVGPEIGKADVTLPLRLLEVASGSRQLQQRLESEDIGFKSINRGGGGYHPREGVSSPHVLQQMLAFHQPGSFPTMNLRTLLEGELTQQHRNLLRDSIVLIGNTASSKKDTFATPFSLGNNGEIRQEMPGVEVHAHRLASLLSLAANKPLGIQAVPGGLNKMLLLFAIVAGLLVGEGIPNLRQSMSLGLWLVLLSVVVASGVLLWGFWLDVAFPLSTFILLCTAAWARRGADQQRKRYQVQHLLAKSTLHSLQLKKHQQFVRELFGRFVSAEIAEKLLTMESPQERESTLMEVTILMADIRGFSLISQRLDPADVMRLLNVYHESMIKIVTHHGGTIDEMFGDSMLVFFGAPAVCEHHREMALTCALAMQHGIEGVNHKNFALGLPAVEMGIGICTGEVMVGTIGSAVRAKYGVVGTAVNLAARIEELTIGGEILVAESTTQGILADLFVVDEYLLEPKGSDGSLRVFSIAGISGANGLHLSKILTQPMELSRPFKISFCTMNGKHRDEHFRQAVVTHAGERGARLSLSEECLKPFVNLALRIPGTDEIVYAKVRRIGDHVADIHYTYVPDAAKAVLASAVRQGDG